MSDNNSIKNRGTSLDDFDNMKFNPPNKIERFILDKFFPECNRLIFLSFLAFVVVRYIQLGARREILATIRFEFLVGLGVIGLAIFQLGSFKPDLKESKALLVAISMLFGVMILQLPLAADPIAARMIFVDRVIKFAFLTFFMVVFIRSPRDLNWFLMAFLFSIFYITLESVEGLISGSLIWQNQGVMRLHGAVPIYAHSNSLGGVALGSIPFVVFLFPLMRRWYIKLALLGLAWTSLICVVYSGSRTAYVGILSLIVWWFIQTKSKFKFITVGAIIGFLVLAAIPDQYIERFQSIGGEEKEGRSSEKRIEILNDALTIFLENPLGIGLASFPAVRLQRFGRHQDTHNLYLEVATNLGIQGLAVFLTLIFVMMFQLRKTAFTLRAQRKRLILLWKTKGGDSFPFEMEIRSIDEGLAKLEAVCKAAGGFIFIRLFLGMFGMDLYEVYWWFGAGLAFVLSGLTSRYIVAIDTLEGKCIDQGYTKDGQHELTGRKRFFQSGI